MLAAVARLILVPDAVASFLAERAIPLLVGNATNRRANEIGELCPRLRFGLVYDVPNLTESRIIELKRGDDRIREFWRRAAQ